MVAIAVIALIVVVLLVIFGSIRKKTLFLNKWLIVAAVAAIAVLVVQGKIDNTSPGEAKLLKSAPSYVEAPYIASTSSRDYLVGAYRQTDDGPILTVWYTYDKKWVKSDKPLPLLKNIYGDVQIVRRAGE